MHRSHWVLGSVLMLVWACSTGSGEKNLDASKKPVTGQSVYKTHCAICHGDDGRKGFAGAKLLPESMLSVAERVALITRGKGAMMPFADVLKTDEIKAVAEYTTTLK